MLPKIFCDSIQELPLIFPDHSRIDVISEHHLQRSSKSFQVPSPQRQSVIRLHSRRTRRALDHIQPVHVPIRITPSREITRVARRAGESRIEKIGVERNDDVGLRQVVARLNRLAERQLRAFNHVIAIDRFVDVPLRHRIRREITANLRGQRGRGNGLRQNAYAAARQAFLHVHGAADGFHKTIPRTNVSQVGDVLSPVGIVEIENRSLRVNVGAAETGRVLRIALNFCGTEQMAFNQNRRGVTSERERGRVEHRPARNEVFRLPHIRHDLGVRHPRTTGQTGELRKPRREKPSSHSEAPFGNSRCSIS